MGKEQGLEAGKEQGLGKGSEQALVLSIVVSGEDSCMGVGSHDRALQPPPASHKCAGSPHGTLRGNSLPQLVCSQFHICNSNNENQPNT